MVATLQFNGDVIDLEACDCFTKEDDGERLLVCRFVVEPDQLTQEQFGFLAEPQATVFVVTAAGLEHHIKPMKSVIQASEIRQENPHTLDMEEGSELQIALVTNIADTEYRLG